MTSLAKWMSAQKIAHGFFKDFTQRAMRGTGVHLPKWELGPAGRPPRRKVSTGMLCSRAHWQKPATRVPSQAGLVSAGLPGKCAGVEFDSLAAHGTGSEIAFNN
jgi:hypothetical protein